VPVRAAVVPAVAVSACVSPGDTIAHHVYTEDGTRKIMIASLRYLDTFAKIDGSWYFAARDLILDWSETRSLAEVAAA
jgi:hypothetical protein